MSTNEPLGTIEEKLDAILHHVARMDRRDRWRTIGGLFRSIIGLLPIIATLYGLWYLYEHGDELLQQMTETITEQAASITQKGTESLLQSEQAEQLIEQLLNR